MTLDDARLTLAEVIRASGALHGLTEMQRSSHEAVGLAATVKALWWVVEWLDTEPENDDQMIGNASLRLTQMIEAVGLKRPKEAPGSDATLTSVKEEQ